MRLIAESGSTKTHWVLLGKQEPQRFSSVGINPYYIDAYEIAKLLKPIFDHELSVPISEVFFYGTGITDTTKSQTIADGIKLALGYGPQVHTYSDIVASAIALHGHHSGIACILGTGSNSCLWDGEAIIYQVPPLGFWLGDEGSGGNLGKLLMLSYLHKSLPQQLRTIFETKYGILSRQEIMQKAYKEAAPNRYFASFAPFYKENVNDPFIIQLLQESFNSFFELYIKKYPTANENPLGFVGSIAFHFRDQLALVAASYGFKSIECLQSPIDKIVAYHQE